MTQPALQSSAGGRAPGWMGALAGVWHLMSGTQLTSRRMLAQLAFMLVLPALIYSTVYTKDAWSKRHLSFSGRGIAAFSQSMERGKTPLPPETETALQRILMEENLRAETGWRERSGEPAEDRLERLQNQIITWNSRILARAKEVLNDAQYAKFRAFQQRDRDLVTRRLVAVSVPWRRVDPFYHWLIDFYLFIILPLVCVRACGPLIRDEVQADTLGFLLSRPVTRTQLIVSKYICQTALLEMVLLLETVFLFAAGTVRHVPSLGRLFPLVIAVQILVVPAWSALGLLLGQITSRYMAAALVYGCFVELGIGRIPSNINTLSLTRHVETLLWSNPALQSVYAWEQGSTLIALCALVAAPIIFLSLATLIFNVFEYHHAVEMQK